MLRQAWRTWVCISANVCGGREKYRGCGSSWYSTKNGSSSNFLTSLKAIVIIVVKASTTPMQCHYSHEKYQNCEKIGMHVSHKTQRSAKAQYVSGDISETQCAVDDEHEGHTGMIRMKALARGCLWWVGLDKDIQNFICKCTPCELRWNQPPSLLFIHGPGWQHPGIHVDYAEIE